MRNALVWAVLGVAVVGTGANAAPARTEKVPYVTGANVSPVLTGTTRVNNDLYGAALVRTRTGERYVDVTVADETGVPVLAQVGQDVDGDGRVNSAEMSAPFCGTARRARVAKPGRDLSVFVAAGRCGSGVSVPTRGVVTVMFGR